MVEAGVGEEGGEEISGLGGRRMGSLLSDEGGKGVFTPSSLIRRSC